MFGSDAYETLFAISALLFQVVLIIHFALRKWRFELAMRYGPAVYALSIPAAILSAIIMLNGKTWEFWLSGFIYLIWASFGYLVEYRLKITEWREPIRWSIFLPYIFLYLAAVMFYWWPLALIDKPLWYLYASLFIISTILNITSHKKSGSEK
ncbi:MAG: hypothetical protein MUC85_05030 [Anaerolineales bacterium]|jgi:hypothetical protein|nr:hypothetical protein [Anaerolineales bacterium]